MRFKFINILIIISAITAGVFAQNPNDTNRRVQELIRRWQTVYDLALRYNNQEALNLLQKSKKNYEQALQLAQKGELERARLKLVQAELQLKSASQLVISKHEVRFRNDLDKIMRRAEKAVFKTTNDEARYFLNKAKAFRDKSEQAYGRGNYIRSQEFYRVAVFFAEKATQVADRGSVNSINKTTLEEYYKNLERLRQQISPENLSGKDQQELLRKVDNYLNQSRNSYQNGRLRQAFVYLQIAERFLYRLVDLSGGADGTSNDEVKENLESLRHYLDGIGRNLDQDATGKSRQLLNKAEKFYNASWRDYEAGNLEKARQKIFLSQRLAARAVQFAGQNSADQTEVINDRAKEVERLLILLEDKCSDANNHNARELCRQARKFYEQARRAIEKRKPAQAYHRLQLALRFLNRADQLLSTSQTAVSGMDEIRERYNRIKSTIGSLNFDEDKFEMKNILQKLSSHIEQAINDNNNELAVCHLDILEKQLQEYLRRTVR